MLGFYTLPLLAATAHAHLHARNNTGSTAQVPNVVRSLWDGQCFYPVADETFNLTAYLGTWYQLAGTVAPFTEGCSCITANYALNANGTVQVVNTCQIQGRQINITGEATTADSSYGVKGVFQVQFPMTPGPECAGPNYIVQDYTGDFAIVQASNFSTLFVLSRLQVVQDNVIDRAGVLGSNLTEVVKTNQTGCS